MTERKTSAHTDSPIGQNNTWLQKLSPFQDRTWRRGAFQLLNTVLPYLAIMATMIVMVVTELPFWIPMLLVVPAALFLVRVFIIFHDCTHGSFLPSNRANRIVGFLTGLLVFTPFEPWRLSHLKHHATNGQLDHRGFGDVRTMTYEEYETASRWQRLVYRVYRHPFVLFVLGSIHTFLILHRVAGLGGSAAERRSVLLTNLGIAAIVAAISIPFGLITYAAVQLPVIFLAGVVGIWLFYVQHQFDPGYWAHDEKWERLDAALLGSSYYRLPKVLQWFTGNIGIHHVHHLRPRIPNYRLQRAYDNVPETHIAKPLTFWRSLKAVRYNLWSEAQERFLSFREAARLMRGKSLQS